MVLSPVLAGAVDFTALELIAAPRFLGADLTSVFACPFGVIALVYFFSGIGLVIYFMLGGFQMLFSKGDPKAVQQAQAKIMNAIIGAVIIFTSYWIVQLIGLVLSLTAVGDVFR